MFDKNKTYWFSLRGKTGAINIKGKVVEENNFMVKVLREATEKYPESEQIIMLGEIIRVNEAVL